QQQSAAFFNIQLRGDGGLFGSASFPILDYRSLSGPGLGTFDPLNSPLNNIDIDRIEVVRGPGSALYGPDVTSGVVHFITKSPIDQPGTTIELIGGELSTFGGALRHATKVSDKFGFKVNVQAKKGNEFTLDPDDPTDALQIAKFSRTISSPAISNGVVDATQAGRVLLTEQDLDPDGDGNMMQQDWNQFLLNATLEFRPADDFSINLAGGTNNASHVFYNSQGEGLSQATEYWTQARFQKGGLFGQVFWLHNNGGTDDKPTFLYQTGNTTPVDRTQLEAQLQYNWDMPSLLDANFTGGVDFRQSTANTFNQVYGREEDDDNFGIYGAYLQGKFALGDKLDLVMAGRVDQFTFLDETAFQPRAVLVFKPSPKHTIRGGYNKAVGAPTQLQVNIDFPVSTPVPGAFDIWLLGNKEAQTFNNPVIQLNGLLGGAQLPIGTPGLPNAVAFGAVNELVLAQLIPGLAAATQSPDLAAAIGAYLRDPANTPGGTTGQFFGFNLFDAASGALGLIEAPKARLRQESTWEVGYKGLIGDKFGVLLDVYNKSITNATLFTGISPAYTLLGSENIGNDLGAAVAGNGVRDYIFALLGGDANPAAGPTADALTGAIQGAYVGGGNAFASNIAPLIAGGILATTPTDQVPAFGGTHLAAGYRTFESFSYTGVDFGLEYYISQDLSTFFNYSWLSDNVWNPRIQGTEGTARTANGTPTNKFRLGFTYVPEYGFRANATFMHDPSFPVFLGQFSGDTDARDIVDAGFGYKFDNGLALDFTAQNVFDTEYRYYPGFPKLGRRVLGKLTYTFGAK
ncbi:MAG: outer membrane receptor for ferrienterochelin and colicins, partial [Saprospiraceae bacterium]